MDLTEQIKALQEQFYEKNRFKVACAIYFECPQINEDKDEKKNSF